MYYSTYKINSYNDDFSVRVESWEEDDVRISFNGILWDGGIDNITITGVITTSINRNTNPAIFHSFYDDYNKDDLITIDMAGKNKIILKGSCNSSVKPASKDSLRLTNLRGSYKYNFSEFNLAPGSYSSLRDDTDNTISLIHKSSYTDSSDVDYTRSVLVQQGDQWVIGDGGDYELVIKKVY
jgi:hypothetical protein